jgi:hypothetical protein
MGYEKLNAGLLNQRILFWVWTTHRNNVNISTIGYFI